MVVVEGGGGRFESEYLGWRALSGRLAWTGRGLEGTTMTSSLKRSLGFELDTTAGRVVKGSVGCSLVMQLFTSRQDDEGLELHSTCRGGLRITKYLSELQDLNPTKHPQMVRCQAIRAVESAHSARCIVLHYNWISCGIY